MPIKRYERKAKLVEALRSWVLAHPRLAIQLVVILIPLLLTLLFIGGSEFLRQQYWTQQIDLFHQINGGFSEHPKFWLNMSYLGDALVLLPIFSFLIVVKPRIYAAMFGAIPLCVLLVHGGKRVANVPRPAAVLENHSIFILGEELTAHNSLPSGHTATAIVVAVVLAIFVLSVRNRGKRIVSLCLIGLLAVLIALSRVVVAAHWPFDLVYGAACGYLGALSGIALTYRYTRWWQWMKRASQLPLVGCILLFWGVALHAILGIQLREGIVIIYLASFIGVAVGLYLILQRYFIASLSSRQFSLTLKFKYPSIEFHRTE